MQAQTALCAGSKVQDNTSRCRPHATVQHYLSPALLADMLCVGLSMLCSDALYALGVRRACHSTAHQPVFYPWSGMCTALHLWLSTCM